MQKKFKIFTIFVGCLLLRLIPLRAPNVEPIMASIMPLGRKFGASAAFLFGFLSIFIYDLLTHFGSWTWIAGITYGVIGAVASVYFQKYKTSRANFVLFTILATIAFDFITGVLFAPVFGQNIINALILQIPFTILHLVGNIGFALTLSPVINRWFLAEQKFVPHFSLRELLPNIKKI